MQMRQMLTKKNPDLKVHYRKKLVPESYIVVCQTSYTPIYSKLLISPGEHRCFP